MDRGGIVFWTIVILGLAFMGGLCVISTIPRLDVIFAQNQTELNKTGYVIDIEFICGGIGPAGETIIRFSDGDVVVLQYWKTKIPIKQNITLQYHDNGYGRCFLDNFMVVKESAK